MEPATLDDLEMQGAINPLSIVGADLDGLSRQQEQFLLVRLLNRSDHSARETAAVGKSTLEEWLKEEAFSAAYEKVCTETELLLENARKLISILSALRHIEFLSTGDTRDRKWAVEMAYRMADTGSKSDVRRARASFESMKARLAEELLDERRGGVPEVHEESDTLPGQLCLDSGPSDVPDDQTEAG